MITEIEIREHEQRLYKAMKESDTRVLDELLHENMLFIIPGGEVINKENDLQNYSRGLLKIDELHPQIEDLNIIDDLAIIILTMELKGRFNNESFEGNYRYIRFWKTFDDGIKVVGGSGITI